MHNDLPLYYWDASVPMAFAQDEENRINNLDPLLRQSGKDFRLVTASFTVTEVECAFRDEWKRKLVQPDGEAAGREQSKRVADRLDKEVSAKLELTWKLCKLSFVDCYEQIACDAVELVRKAGRDGHELNHWDALHLATAVRIKAGSFWPKLQAPVCAASATPASAIPSRMPLPCLPGRVEDFG
jgi:hypothetical protein